MADTNNRDPQNTGQASYGNSGHGDQQQPDRNQQADRQQQGQAGQQNDAANQQPDRNQQADRQQQGQAGQQGERNPADPNNTHQTDTGLGGGNTASSGQDANRNEPGGVSGEDQR